MTSSTDWFQWLIRFDNRGIFAIASIKVYAKEKGKIKKRKSLHHQIDSDQDQSRSQLMIQKIKPNHRTGKAESEIRDRSNFKMDFYTQKTGKEINVLRAIAVLLLLTIIVGTAMASYSDLPAAVNLMGKIKLFNNKEKDLSNIGIWLVPIGAQPNISPTLQTPTTHQKNKRFIPHMLFAVVGQEVNFPNDDPFPHNIFSNSDVKKFDLGFIRAGKVIVCQ
jgi:hypothetical protein